MRAGEGIEPPSRLLGRSMAVSVCAGVLVGGAIGVCFLVVGALIGVPVGLALGALLGLALVAPLRFVQRRSGRPGPAAVTGSVVCAVGAFIAGVVFSLLPGTLGQPVTSVLGFASLASAYLFALPAAFVGAVIGPKVAYGAPFVWWTQGSGVDPRRSASIGSPGPAVPVRERQGRGRWSWSAATSFSGRASRREFGAYLAVAIGLYALAFGLDSLSGSSWPTVAAVVLLIVPMLAVTIRRLRDAGLFGGLVLLGLIPLFGLIIVLALCLCPPERNPGPGRQVLDTTPEPPLYVWSPHQRRWTPTIEGTPTPST